MLKEDLQKQLRDSGYKGEFDLSSLVEACEHPGFFLYRNGFDTLFIWGASISSKEEAQYGSTPEEAAASLWLALQK